MKKKIWIAVALIAAVVISGVVIILVLQNRDNENDEPNGFEINRVGNAVVGEGVVTPNEDWLEDDVAGDLDENTYVFNMWETTWRFTDGDSPSYDASIVNDMINSNPVYLELILDSTEEVLFVSDYMEPGDSLHGVELGTHLEKGEYGCTLIYHLMDQEKKEEVDTVRLAITVVIEN